MHGSQDAGRAPGEVRDEGPEEEPGAGAAPAGPAGEEPAEGEPGIGYEPL